VQLSSLRKSGGLVLLLVSFQTLFLMVLGLSQNMVLCVGSDGHVALEAARADGSCATLLESRARAYPAAIGSEDHTVHCGPCLDVDFPGESLLPRAVDPCADARALCHMSGLPISAATPYAQSLHQMASRHPPSCTSTPSAILRSTVLLV